MSQSISDLLNSGSTIPYDQVEIEAVMKKLLYEYGITDVLYPGSNISMLTSVVSYVIGALNINTAINLQETLLPLASKRMNVLFGARQLGYEPHQRRSFIYRIGLKPMYDDTKIIQKDPDDPNSEWVIDPLNQEARTIPLHKNTKFRAGGKTYYYLGETIKDFFVCSNFEITKGLPPSNRREIEIKEGQMIFHKTVDGQPGDPTLSMVVRSYPDEQGIVRPEQEFIIPHRNIEEDGIQVEVITPDYKSQWTGDATLRTIQKKRLRSFLVDTTFDQEKDTFIRMENLILQYPAIFFEYNGLGTPVKSGDVINVNVLISSGADGNLTQDLTVEGTTESQLFKVDNTYGAYELQMGQDVETSKSIKENAALFNNSANRAVTQNDWVAVTSSHSMVKAAAAWGGEEEFDTSLAPGDCFYEEPLLGHVWVSVVPYYSNDFEYREKVSAIFAAGAAGQPDRVVTPEKPEIYENIWFPEPLDVTPIQDIADSTHEWYLSNKQIYGTFDPKAPPLPHCPEDDRNHDKPLLQFLDYYKIITMEVHHRHPVYFNFSFIADVVKYNLSESRYEVHKKVFDTMNDYFNDQMAKFNAEYIHSNLQRVLDQMLSFQSGIALSVRVQACMMKAMIDEFAGGAYIDLSMPFEDMWVNSHKDEEATRKGLIKGDLKTWLLPRIDTDDFGAAKGKIRVNYDDPELKKLTLGQFEKKSTAILYNNTRIGTYTVNKKTRAIELMFFETPTFESKIDEIFGTSATETRGEYAYLDIVYPFSDKDDDDLLYKSVLNIPFMKNSFPRLQKLEFKDN